MQGPEIRNIFTPKTDNSRVNSCIWYVADGVEGIQIRSGGMALESIAFLFSNRNVQYVE